MPCFVYLYYILSVMLAVIINPKSGGSKYRRQRLYLFRILQQRNIDFVYRVTKYAAHATEIARQLVEQGCRRLLVLGGDGTLSEVVDGIMHAQVSSTDDIELGIIPRGTGNDWGRWCQLDKDYKRSIDIFLNSGTKVPIDIGCISLMRAGEQEKHYFINSVGFGIDSKTCKKAVQLKPYLGSHSINYFIGLLSAVFTHKTVPARILTDGEFTTDKPLFTMNIGNGPYSGGGIRQNPDADPTDGVFHAMFVSKPTIKDIFRALPKLFNGRLKEISFINNFVASRVVIQTNDYMLFEKDGILVDACGPYEISLIPHAIKMIISR